MHTLGLKRRSSESSENEMHGNKRVRFDYELHDEVNATQFIRSFSTDPTPPQCHCFWETLWKSSEDHIPFLLRRKVVRDGTIRPLRSRPTLNVPENFWTLNIPTEIARAFGLLSAKQMLRHDHMLAIKALFGYVKWGQPHDAPATESLETIVNPFFHDGPPRKVAANATSFTLTGQSGTGA